MDHLPIEPLTDVIAKRVVDAGMKIHKALGPGLLESVYEHCVAYELSNCGVAVKRQVSLPITYDGQTLDAGYRIDIIADDRVIVEIKSVEALLPIHEAQLHTYLKLSGCRVGLLLNFNVALFKNGIRRRVN